MKALNKILTFFIALVWFVNGFFCKILNLVPRHRQIVSRILGNDYSIIITNSIGVLEILMAVWILSGIKKRLNVIIQILVIGIMNILEHILASDLLLWGKANLLFAFIFIIVIYCHTFVLNKITAG